MAEIYGRETGICQGYGGSMHLIDVERGFLGTSGIVGQGIPHAAGRAGRPDPRQGSGRALVLRRRRLEAGRVPRDLNIASLWKLPVVFVMENNNYQAYTRVEQEDANAAAGEPLAVKAKATACRARTVDGGDPVAVYETMHAAVERALRRRADARGVHGLPPQRPRQHHRAARRAAALPGARGDRDLQQRRGVRGRAQRGDPVPRFRARLVTEGALSAEEADEIAEAARKEMDEAVEFGLASPLPAPEKAVEHVYA